MHINPRVVATGAPPIPAVQGWMREYDGRAGPLIDLCQAVPGYPPPTPLLDRLAREAATPANARYGAILGETPLRDAYAAHLAALYDAPARGENIAITAGCNQAFFAAASAVAGPGDAMVLPQPWYFNHEMTLRQLGIEARPLPCDETTGFVPAPDALERLLAQPGSCPVRAVVLVTPNNPTGAICPADTVAAISALCREHGVWLILDETYRDFLPEEQVRLHDLLRTPEWPAHVIQLYSFSKAYAVPGQRVGALAGPETLLPQLAKVLDCLHVCAQRPAQLALAWALDATVDWRHDNRAKMNRRSDTLRSGLAGLPHWPVASQGAYFAYVRHPFGEATGWDVVRHLALQHGIGCLPGSAFGGSDGFLRIAYANVGLDGVHELVRRLGSVAAGVADL
jgi:aspartate/methionine/tyrosine aminotransferase